MKVLKQRPNIVFIAFILIVFCVFTAATLVFHTSVSESTFKEQKTASELAATKDKLNRTQTILDNIENELNKSKSDIETFDSLYTETNTELEKTTSALDVTKSQLTASEALVKQQVAQIGNLTKLYDELTNKVRTDNQTIEKLQNDITKLEDDIQDICDDYPEPKHNDCD